MQKINFQNLPNTTTPVNATNMNGLQTNVENAINIFDLYNDTSGADWQTMMKNKIDYCIANMDSTKENTSAFINGGWSGNNYGCGICTKIGTVYQLLWVSSDKIYFCRKLTDHYDYTDFSSDTGWTNCTLTSNFEQSGWNNLKYKKKNGIVYIIGTVSTLTATSWASVITTLPSGFRPIGEVDVICRTSWDQVMKLAMGTNGELITLNLNDGNQLPTSQQITINISYPADN